MAPGRKRFHEEANSSCEALCLDLLGQCFPEGTQICTLLQFGSYGFTGCAPAFPAHVRPIGDIMSNEEGYGVISCEVSPLLKVTTNQGVVISHKHVNVSKAVSHMTDVKTPQDCPALEEYARKGRADMGATLKQQVFKGGFLNDFLRSSHEVVLREVLHWVAHTVKQHGEPWFTYHVFGPDKTIVAKLQQVVDQLISPRYKHLLVQWAAEAGSPPEPELGPVRGLWSFCSSLKYTPDLAKKMAGRKSSFGSGSDSDNCGSNCKGPTQDTIALRFYQASHGSRGSVGGPAVRDMAAKVKHIQSMAPAERSKTDHAYLAQNMQAAANYNNRALSRAAAVEVKKQGGIPADSSEDMRQITLQVVQEEWETVPLSRPLSQPAGSNLFLGPSRSALIKALGGPSQPLVWAVADLSQLHSEPPLPIFFSQGTLETNTEGRVYITRGCPVPPAPHSHNPIAAAKAWVVDGKKLVKVSTHSGSAVFWYGRVEG